MSNPYPTSYYAATAHSLPTFPTAVGQLHYDVCVIGGGYTGLSTALHLAKRGYRVAIIEAQRVAWGASGRNGGQLGSGQRLDQDSLEQRLGTAHARQLWQLAEQAKALAKRLIRDHAIQCDLKPGIATAIHKPSLLADEQRYCEKLNRDYGYSTLRNVNRSEMAELLGTDVYFGGTLDTDAAHLHPLNYALGLARVARQFGVDIYENSLVSDFRQRGDGTVVTHTAASELHSRYLAIACNGYLGNLARPLSGKIMPINNFILATQPLSEAAYHSILPTDIAVADSRFVVNYFRLSADRRLLFGGGENYTQRYPRDLKKFVRRHMLAIYPQLQTIPIDYAWGGTLAVTRNRMPHFGRLSPTIYFAQGYSGHGVALATLAGDLIAAAIAGTAEQFDLLAQLKTRRFPGGHLLRWPGLALGMLYYSIRDKL